MNDLTPISTNTTPNQMKPTKETYERLQQAFEHLDKALFGAALPRPLITLQRRRNTYGYFAGARFSGGRRLSSARHAVGKRLPSSLTRV